MDCVFVFALSYFCIEKTVTIALTRLLRPEPNVADIQYAGVTIGQPFCVRALTNPYRIYCLFLLAGLAESTK